MTSKFKKIIFFIFISTVFVPLLSIMLSYFLNKKLASVNEMINFEFSRKRNKLYKEIEIYPEREGKLYLALEIPETQRNLNLLTLSFNCSVSQRNLELLSKEIIFNLKYKNYFYTQLESFYMFFPILFNFYSQSQKIYKEICTTKKGESILLKIEGEDTYDIYQSKLFITYNNVFLFSFCFNSEFFRMFLVFSFFSFTSTFLFIFTILMIIRIYPFKKEELNNDDDDDFIKDEYN